MYHTENRGGIAINILLMVHVGISLLGIVSGLIVLFAWAAGHACKKLTSFFLAMTVLTSLTGFVLPAAHFMPSHAVGILSLIVLALVYVARHNGLNGRWRTVFVIGAVLAQYLNFFVLVVQSFMKVPALHALAPTQTEPPFKIVQTVVLIGFAALGALALKKYPAGNT